MVEEDISHKKGIRKKVMLRKGQIPHITQFAQAIIPAGEIVEGHSHQDMYEIFFVEEGEGEVKINGMKYPLKKGSYIIIEPRENHEFSSNSELILTYFGVRV